MSWVRPDYTCATQSQHWDGSLRLRSEHGRRVHRLEAEKQRCYVLLEARAPEVCPHGLVVLREPVLEGSAPAVVREQLVAVLVLLRPRGHEEEVPKEQLQVAGLEVRLIHHDEHDALRVRPALVLVPAKPDRELAAFLRRPASRALDVGRGETRENFAGTTTTTFSRTAFGETTRGGAAFPCAFTGRRCLESLKLYDDRSRFYDPWLGRFLQRDPIGIFYGNLASASLLYKRIFVFPAKGSPKALRSFTRSPLSPAPQPWETAGLERLGAFRPGAASRGFLPGGLLLRDRSESGSARARRSRWLAAVGQEHRDRSPESLPLRPPRENLAQCCEILEDGSLPVRRRPQSL
ncbi:MAG: RHS repeat-associated core domain-containing protein [Planctomycetota bacterium]